jgi:hypothetical protein
MHLKIRFNQSLLQKLLVDLRHMSWMSSTAFTIFSLALLAVTTISNIDSAVKVSFWIWCAGWTYNSFPSAYLPAHISRACCQEHPNFPAYFLFLLTFHPTTQKRNKRYVSNTSALCIQMVSSPLKPKLGFIIFNHSVCNSRQAQPITTTEIEWLMLFKEII